MTNQVEIEPDATHSPTLGKLFDALSKAQGKLQNALKDKKNPFFKSSYADLTSVWDACRQTLSENSLSVIQTMEGARENMCLITWLGHSSGEWVKSSLPIILIKMDSQSLGSAISYARRYALAAIVGVCSSDDDDGEKSMARDQPKHENKQPQKQQEIKYISDKQCEEIGKLLSFCDPKIKENFPSLIKGKPFFAETISQIKEHDFDKIYKRLRERSDEYLESSKEEVQDDSGI